MISGTTVTILRPGTPTVDRFNNAVPGEPVPQEVAGAIVAPGATSELDASRPEGATVAYTVHMPPDGAHDLEGAKIALPEPFGGTYRVIGLPPRYMEENMPSRFAGFVPVEVEAAHG